MLGGSVVSTRLSILCSLESSLKKTVKCKVSASPMTTSSSFSKKKSERRLLHPIDFQLLFVAVSQCCQLFSNQFHPSKPEMLWPLKVSE